MKIHCYIKAALKCTATFIVLLALSSTLIFLLYKGRGYLAFGGEYLIITLAMILSIVACFSTGKRPQFNHKTLLNLASLSDVNLEKFALRCGYKTWPDFEDAFTGNEVKMEHIVELAHFLGYDSADQFIDDVVE